MENAILILISILVMAGMGAILGIGLNFAYRKLKVKEDERLKKVLEILPGLNCGACGYASCEEFAKKLLEGEVPVDGCRAGGEKIAGDLKKYMGTGPFEQKDSLKARLKCNARDFQKMRGCVYEGSKSCLGANMLGSSGFTCFEGCLGLGDCKEVCPVSAITMREGRPQINIDKCIGCGLCVKACPRSVIDLASLKESFKELVIVGCSCTQGGVETRKMCKAGCIACGKCVKVCPVDAVSLKENLALIEVAKCTGCGECVEACPTKAIYIM